ncbi:unnamed protein product [Rotaria magnacalcarata]|uniref:Uncharacterized protein n=1 Tax=Rotaria magnacalcarata TaxID=392030 RepID=A0A819R5U4_9BILA|nr:unnamed protein product [Rotaria magnacalcarata]CAF1515642.1 unnamed protein product [Rotaria magnacalcarata]CAF1955571.1 unnamed protein product [Rotaria magnacalcarata]CAF2066706.1 unnamed protein product [Rotaria magnacalcarata]CAF2098997.1 unnamed protein product [Rotaria magnacalcarata]
MATSAAASYVSVSSSTPASRNNKRVSQLTSIDNNSHRTNVNKESMISVPSDGVPVKFGDNLFSVLIKDQVSQLLDLPQIKQLDHVEENAVRKLTHDITEMLKRIVAQHVKDNYKAIIQVISYPKQDENSIVIMSRCLWNHRTDDVLSVEIDTDAFKFIIIIHGVAA